MRSYARQNKRLARRYDEWMSVMHYAKETRSKYRKSVRQFVDSLNDKSVVRVTHWDIRHFMAQLSERGASLDSIYRHLGVLRLFFDFLNLGGLVSYVAPRFIKVRRPRTNIGPILSELQVRRLITAAETLRERALVELFYGTGCRLSEARHLKVENVDLETRNARVTGKFGKVRVVLLTRSSTEALRAYIGDRKSGFVFRQDLPIQKGCVAKRGNYWVGLWNDYSESGPNRTRKVLNLGRIDRVPYEEAKAKLNIHLSDANLVRPPSTRPLSKVAIQIMLRHIGERANLRNVSPHVLRRSFATHLYDHGASLEVVKALLGHVYLQTTIKYTQLSTRRLVKTFERCHPRGKLNVQELQREQEGQTQVERNGQEEAPVHW